MEFRFIPTLVAVVVGVTLFSALLLPLITDATDTDTAFENDGYFNLTKYGTDTPVTIEWDHTTPAILKVNDVDNAFTAPTNMWVNYAIGDTWYVRAAGDDSNRQIQVSYGGANAIVAKVADSTDIEVVCDSGTATIKLYSAGEATNTQTVSYTNLYVIDGDGAYTMKKADKSAYMAADSEYIGLGVKAVTGGVVLYKVTNDGAEVVAYSTGLNATISEDSVTVNTTELPKNIGVALSSIQFTVTTVNGDSAETFNSFIVPATVTLELTQHPDDTEIALLNVIPILVVVGLVIGVIGALFVRRND